MLRQCLSVFALTLALGSVAHAGTHSKVCCGSGDFAASEINGCIAHATSSTQVFSVSAPSVAGENHSVGMVCVTVTWSD